MVVCHGRVFVLYVSSASAAQDPAATDSTLAGGEQLRDRKTRQQALPIYQVINMEVAHEFFQAYSTKKSLQVAKDILIDSDKLLAETLKAKGQKPACLDTSQILTLQSDDLLKAILSKMGGKVTKSW